MLRISLEPLTADDGSVRVFAHIEADRVFGYAALVKAGVPKGAWMSVPPHLRPIDEWLVRKCGFARIGTVELDGVENAVLEKVI